MLLVIITINFLIFFLMIAFAVGMLLAFFLAAWAVGNDPLQQNHNSKSIYHVNEAGTITENVKEISYPD